MDIIEKARAAAAFVGSAFKAVATVVFTTRIPPGRIEVTAEQMSINYKALAISIILVFLARGLEGSSPDGLLGSLLVVIMFLLLALVLQGAAAILTKLAARLKAGGIPQPADAPSKQWFTLLTAMWTWGLGFVVLHGIIHNWLEVPHLNLFFNVSFVVPGLAAVLALISVITISKIVGKIDPEIDRVFAVYALLSAPLIAMALWAAVFWKF